MSIVQSNVQKESKDNQVSVKYQPMEKIEHPIVIVPGFMASCLYTNSNYKVWPATWPFSIRKLAIKNKLKSKGLVPSYYSGLMKFLHYIGYEEDETLFVFSNDWR